MIFKRVAHSIIMQRKKKTVIEKYQYSGKGQHTAREIPEIDLLQQAQKSVSCQNIVAEIWGKWPGEESFDELLQDLKDSKSEK